MIQAGGAGSRMDVLTRERAKPVLPFAGSYRMIDFPLSNLRNSEVEDVWVAVQFLARSITEVVSNGKPWDLDRNRGGFRLVVPEQGTGSVADEGFVSGNAEQLLQIRDAIRSHDPEVLLVLSADHVYRLDYRDVIEEHLRRGAECTIVTTEVSLDDAGHHACVTVDDDGRVVGFDYKPDEPTTTTVATEIFAYAPGPLIEVLEQEHRRLSTTAEADGEDGEDGSLLGDFGEYLIPALVERGQVHGWALPGYWRDLGRPEAYLTAHLELLDGDTDLFRADWPIITARTPGPPARFVTGCAPSTSVISDGCVVAGSVSRSVLGPGVVVEAGASVVESVLFGDVVVEAGAVVTGALVDRGTRIGAGARVGAPLPEGFGADAVAMIGRDAVIAAGAVVPAGARLEPGSTT